MSILVINYNFSKLNRDLYLTKKIMDLTELIRINNALSNVVTK